MRYWAVGKQYAPLGIIGGDSGCDFVRCMHYWA